MPDDIITHQLLQAILHKQKHWRWVQDCVFSDGLEQTFIKISFFDALNKEIASCCFQLETGSIQRHKSMGSSCPETIIDFLLEILQIAQHPLENPSEPRKSIV